MADIKSADELLVSILKLAATVNGMVIPVSFLKSREIEHWLSNRVQNAAHYNNTSAWVLHYNPIRCLDNGNSSGNRTAMYKDRRSAQFWHYTVAQHRTRQKLMYRNNKYTSEVMLIQKENSGHVFKSSGAHWIAGTYTAIIWRVTKLAIVTLDKKVVWSRIQKPTFILHRFVARARAHTRTRTRTHTHTHARAHARTHARTHTCARTHACARNITVVVFYFCKELITEAEILYSIY